MTRPVGQIPEQLQTEKIRYALLIGGAPLSVDEQPIIENDINLYRQMLIERGVPQNHILTLRSPVEHADIISRLKRIRDSVDDQPAEVDIYFTGHGLLPGSSPSLSAVLMQGGFISRLRMSLEMTFFTIGEYWPASKILTDGVLNRYVDNIIPEHVSVNLVVDACFAGGFTAIDGGRTTVITSSDKETMAHYTADMQYGHFSYHFLSAMRSEYPNGDAVEADYNDDGTTTYEEAFLFASTTKPASGWFDIVFGDDYTPQMSKPTP